MKTIKTLLAASALATVAGAANATIWKVEMSASVYFVAADGPLNMIEFKGTWNDAAIDPVTGLDTGKPSPGTWEGTTTVDGFKTTMHYTQSFTMNEATGSGVLHELDGTTCTDNTGSACNGFGPALSGNIRNTPVNPSDPQNDYKIKIPFTPADGWTGQWTLQVNRAISNPDGSTSTQYIPMPFNVTLRAYPTPAVPVPAAAWLFGSGLISFVGAAFSRRKSPLAH